VTKTQLTANKKDLKNGTEEKEGDIWNEEKDKKREKVGPIKQAAARKIAEPQASKAKKP